MNVQLMLEINKPVPKRTKAVLSVKVQRGGAKHRGRLTSSTD